MVLFGTVVVLVVSLSLGRSGGRRLDRDEATVLPGRLSTEYRAETRGRRQPRRYLSAEGGELMMRLDTCD